MNDSPRTEVHAIIESCRAADGRFAWLSLVDGICSLIKRREAMTREKAISIVRAKFAAVKDWGPFRHVADQTRDLICGEIDLFPSEEET